MSEGIIWDSGDEGSHVWIEGQGVRWDESEIRGSKGLGKLAKKEKVMWTRYLRWEVNRAVTRGSDNLSYLGYRGGWREIRISYGWTREKGIGLDRRIGLMGVE